MALAFSFDDNESLPALEDMQVASPATERLNPSTSARTILQEFERAIASETAPRRAADTMRVAMELQFAQNDADADWLEGLDISPDVASEILVRLVERGGIWLDFVKALVRYRGSLGRLLADV